jgi:hypothetical protein
LVSDACSIREALVESDLSKIFGLSDDEYMPLP